MSKRGDMTGHLLWGVAAAAVTIYALLPVGWMVSLSLKPATDLADGLFIPRRVTLENYRAVFADPQFPAALRNSLGIAAIATLLAVGLAILAAYAIVRLRFPGRSLILSIAVAIAMFPQVSIVGPLFDLWRLAGLFDTWAGLVLPYMTFSLPLALWTLTAFFREVPWELEQAARVDGATRLQALRKVILPLAAPGILTTSILVFLFAWNDFLFAASLTSTSDARTVPVAIAFFTGSSQFEQPTASIAAAAVLVTVPVAVVVLVFQRRIISGLTAGAVKG